MYTRKRAIQDDQVGSAASSPSRRRVEPDSDQEMEEQEQKTEALLPYERLLQALADVVKGPSEGKENGLLFACQGTIIPNELYRPGIKVAGKHLPLPADKNVLERLVADGQVIHAPFGRGEATITDLNVRKTYQVSNNAVEVENAQFLEEIQTLAKRCALVLGLHKSEEVVARFHKLLIYGPGDFFTPHRDGVHSENQFGTLVVQLPSVYTGGTLVVRKGDETVYVKQGGKESHYSFMYSAFFADCIHEVLPIESGVRICLTFDLCHVVLPNTSFVESSSLTESKPVGNPTKEGIAKVESALHGWYQHLNDPATLSKRAGASTEACDCGQPSVESHRTALFDGDVPGSEQYHDEDEGEDVLNELDGDERLREVFKRRFRSSDTEVMFLVLDHLLPHNVLDIISREGIANSLWAFRGTDRMRVMALIEALLRLKNQNQVDFDIKLCKCAYADYNQLTAEKMFPPHLDQETKICTCMVKCFSTMTADLIHDRHIETGNEGEQHEFRYEFAAVMIYPRFRRPNVLATIFNGQYEGTARLPEFLATLTSNEELLEFLDSIGGHPKGTFIQDLAKVGLEKNEAAIALAKRLPLSLLLSDAFLGPAGNRRSTGLSLAAVLLVLYRLTMGEKCLLDGESHTRFSLANVIDVLQTCATTFTEKEMLAIVGELAVDLAFLGNTESFDNLVFTRLADRPDLQHLIFTAVVSRHDKLEKVVSPDWLKGCYMRIQERLEAWLKDRMEANDNNGFDHKAEFALQAICSLIRTWSSPGNQFYSVSLRLAEMLSRSDLGALQFAAKTWFDPHTESPFTGTIVMRPVVEAFCAAKVKAMDEHLAKQRAELANDIPSRWPDALKAFVTGSEVSTNLPGYTGRRLESSGQLYKFGIREEHQGFVRDNPDIAARAIERQKPDRAFVSKLTDEIVWM